MQNEDRLRNDQRPGSIWQQNEDLPSWQEFGGRETLVSLNQEDHNNYFVLKIAQMLKMMNYQNSRQKNLSRTVYGNVRKGLDCIRKQQIHKSQRISQLQAKLMSTVASYEHSLREKDRTIQQMQKHQLTASISCEKMQSAVEEARIRNAQMEAENKQLQIKITQLNTKANQINKGWKLLEEDGEGQQQSQTNLIAAMRDQIETLKLTIHQLSAKVEEQVIVKEETLSAFKEQLEEKSSQLRSGATALAQHKQVIEELQQEIKKLKLKQLEEQTSLFAQIQRLKSEKAYLLEQSLVLREKNRDMLAKEQQYISKNSELKCNIIELQSKLKSKEAEIEQLCLELKHRSSSQNFSESDNSLREESVDRQQMARTPFQLEAEELEERVGKKGKENLPIRLAELDHNSSSSSSSKPGFSASIQQQQASYDSIDKQQDILEVELEIIKCKYKLLEKMYLELKHQSEDSSTSERKSVAVQTEDKEQNYLGYSFEGEPESDRVRTTELPEQKSLKKSLSGSNLFKAENKLDISIVDSLKGNKNSTLNSPAASLYSFSSFFNSSELESRIRNFKYQASILHKISTSKFITSPTSKIAFVFQYGCFLELYFSPDFLSRVMEELIMGDRIEAWPIGSNDLNPNLVDCDSRKEDRSFLSQSSSKGLSCSKLNIAKQFSMNSFSQVEEGKVRKSGEASSVTPRLIEQQAKLAQLEADTKQVASFLMHECIDAGTLIARPILCDRLKVLSQNEVAKLVIRLTKQNEIMKNCLNVMMKNEEILTMKSNDAYFESVQLEGNHSGQTSEPLQNSPDKQNCVLM